jgi:antitoxin ParD1/3/4
MGAVEKISIALPPEMAAIVRDAVSTGEYASTSEVIRDALRDWIHKRALREQGVVELRKLWQEALEDDRPGVDPNEVFDRLKSKYRAMADAGRAEE